MWASLSLSVNSSPVTEFSTGTTFPAVVNDSQLLLGVGVRRKAILGLKNIDVYAFGVYADAADLENNQLKKDLIDSNIRMTVRLQIVYSRLSINSVRSAFEGSVGSRIRKFSGSDSKGDKELLQRFVSQFRDEYKIPRGSIIDLSRDKDYVLRTSIDGVEVGSIESKLLCKSVLDLYIGDDPFDRKARDEVENTLSRLLRE